MAKVSLNTIKNWFKTGFKPTQAQFWDTWDSFIHKDDEIPTQNIQGLDERFNDKADAELLNAHLTDPSAHGLQNKVDKVEGKGLSTEDFTTIEKDKLSSLQNYEDADLYDQLEAKLDKPLEPNNTADYVILGDGSTKPLAEVGGGTSTDILTVLGTEKDNPNIENTIIRGQSFPSIILDSTSSSGVATMTGTRESNCFILIKFKNSTNLNDILSVIYQDTEISAIYNFTPKSQSSIGGDAILINSLDEFNFNVPLNILRVDPDDETKSIAYIRIKYTDYAQVFYSSDAVSVHISSPILPPKTLSSPPVPYTIERDMNGDLWNTNAYGNRGKLSTSTILYDFQTPEQYYRSLVFIYCSFGDYKVFAPLYNNFPNKTIYARIIFEPSRNESPFSTNPTNRVNVILNGKVLNLSDTNSPDYIKYVSVGGHDDSFVDSTGEFIFADASYGGEYGFFVKLRSGESVQVYANNYFIQVVVNTNEASENSELLPPKNLLNPPVPNTLERDMDGELWTTNAKGIRRKI